MIPSIILSAGYGKRLKPLTNNVPKCLVKINNIPILDFWINKLIKSNYGPFLVNTHYLKNEVIKHIKKSSYKEHIKITNEKKLLGTAGTLIKNLEFCQGKDSLLMHVDNYCKVDMRKFYKEHVNRPKKCMMTMMTFKPDDPINCGILKIDKNNVAKRFYEKSMSKGNYANGAIYLISNEMQNEIKNNFKNAKDFSKDIIPNFLNRIYVSHTNLSFFDIGIIKNYNKVNKL